MQDSWTINLIAAAFEASSSYNKTTCEHVLSDGTSIRLLSTVAFASSSFKNFSIAWQNGTDSSRSLIEVFSCAMFSNYLLCADILSGAWRYFSVCMAISLGAAEALADNSVSRLFHTATRSSEQATSFNVSQPDLVVTDLKPFCRSTYSCAFVAAVRDVSASSKRLRAKSANSSAEVGAIFERPCEAVAMNKQSSAEKIQPPPVFRWSFWAEKSSKSLTESAGTVFEKTESRSTTFRYRW